MDQKQLDEFRILLEKRLEEIKESHNSHRDSLLSTKKDGDIESADWGQQNEDEIVEERIVISDEFYIQKIEKALTRIEAGSYGTCEACDSEIPMPRLQAKPSVSLCLSCQEKKDDGELVL